MFIFIEVTKETGHDPLSTKEVRKEYSPNALLQFAKDNNISLTLEQQNLLNSNTTITRQQAMDILGSHFKNFEKWYEETYLANLRDSTGSFTHGGVKSLPVTQLITENEEKKKRSYKNREKEIAKQHEPKTGDMN